MITFCKHSKIEKLILSELPLSKIKKQGYKQAILRSVTWYGEVASLKALSPMVPHVFFQQKSSLYL